MKKIDSLSGFKKRFVFEGRLRNTKRVLATPLSETVSHFATEQRQTFWLKPLCHWVIDRRCAVKSEILSYSPANAGFSFFSVKSKIWSKTESTLLACLEHRERNNNNTSGHWVISHWVIALLGLSLACNEVWNNVAVIKEVARYPVLDSMRLTYIILLPLGPFSYNITGYTKSRSLPSVIPSAGFWVVMWARRDTPQYNQIQIEKEEVWAQSSLS